MRTRERRTTAYYTEYQQGTAARKIAPVESRRERYYREEEEYRREMIRREKAKRARAQSRNAYLARQKALTIRNLVIISFACTAAVVMCIFYLSLKSDLNRQASEVLALQNQLTDLQEENNTRYNHINDKVSLDDVRDRALNDLGMTYADTSQIVTYSSPTADYLDQNQDMPE